MAPRSPLSEPTWADFAPLLRGSFTTPQAAGQCLWRWLPLWAPSARRVSQHRRSVARHLALDPEDCLHEAMLAVLNKVQQKRGLQPPSDAATPPGCWLRRVFANAMADRLRLAERNGGQPRSARPGCSWTPPVDHTAIDELRPAMSLLAPSSALDERVEATQVARIALRLPGVSARQRLALACRLAPGMVEPDLLREAAVDLEAHGTAPIGVEARHARLQAWLTAHTANPESDAARWELGWAMLGGPAVALTDGWDGGRTEARKADELIRNWVVRAANAAHKALS